MSSTEDILGRSEINDIEAILGVVNQDVDEVEHIVKDNADAIFTWDYTLARPALRKLYEKAKVGQWNATTDLPWDTDVDQEKVVSEIQAVIGTGMDPSVYVGTPVEKWGDKEWLEFGIEQNNWTLSQFMHGEQGALLCTAKICETVPWYDAKLYASTQVVDEARHVEVFAGIFLLSLTNWSKFASKARRNASTSAGPSSLDEIGCASAEKNSPLFVNAVNSARCNPSTNTLTVPSGSLSICSTVATQPVSYKSSGDGSSLAADFCATRRMCLPLSIATSSALIDFGRPTNSGMTMCGNTTTSRSGNKG